MRDQDPPKPDPQNRKGRLKGKFNKVRERLYVLNRLKGKNKRQSAIAAGCPPKSAHVQASKMERRPHVQKLLDSALDRMDAKIEDTARVIGKAHTATFVKPFYDSESGRIVETKPYIDHKTRLAAARLNLEARKHLKGKDEVSGETNIHIGAIVAVIRKECQNRGLPE